MNARPTFEITPAAPSAVVPAGHSADPVAVPSHLADAIHKAFGPRARLIPEPKSAVSHDMDARAFLKEADRERRYFKVGWGDQFLRKAKDYEALAANSLRRANEMREAGRGG